MALIWKAILSIQGNIFSNTWTKDLPPTESVDVAIEDMLGAEQIISVVWQFFVASYGSNLWSWIWGNENNFTGTVNMDDPFYSFNHRCCDNKVDEVVDGVWYKKLCKNVWR